MLHVILSMLHDILSMLHVGFEQGLLDIIRMDVTWYSQVCCMTFTSMLHDCPKYAASFKCMLQELLLPREAVSLVSSDESLSGPKRFVFTSTRLFFSSDGVLVGLVDHGLLSLLFVSLFIILVTSTKYLFHI